MGKTSKNTGEIDLQFDLNSSDSASICGSSCSGGQLVSRVVEAIHRSVSFVFASSRINRKRKIIDDNSGKGNMAKKWKTTSDRNSDDDGNECSICLEPWSAKGDHRLVCLKCGHLFGLSCIIKWIRRNQSCPHCCAAADIQDLRRIFVQRISVEDTSQRDNFKRQLEQEKAVTANLKRNLTLQKLENKALRRELARLKRKIPIKESCVSGGFGISATMTVIRDCLSKYIFEILNSRFKSRSQFAAAMPESKHEKMWTSLDYDVDGGWQGL